MMLPCAKAYLGENYNRAPSSGREMNTRSPLCPGCVGLGPRTAALTRLKERVSCARDAMGFMRKDPEYPKSCCLLPCFLALPPEYTHTVVSSSALVLADLEGSVPWPPPLSLVWIGFPLPHAGLMRSHSHGEPEHFGGLCPPPATPLGEPPLCSIFSFLIASEKSESENAGKL